MADYGLGEDFNYSDSLDLGGGDDGIPTSMTIGGSSGGGGLGGALSGVGAALTSNPVGLAFAGFQLWSGLQQAQMVRAQGDLQKKVSDINAQYAETDAYEAYKQGFSESAKYQTSINKTISTQRANLAGGNVDVNYGTAGQVQAQTYQMGTMNKLAIEAQARSKALGYQREADNIRLNQSMQDVSNGLRAEADQTSSVINFGRNAFDLYKRNSGTPNLRTSNTTGADDYYGN